MLDRHLEMLNVEATTLDSYEVFVRNHIRPLIGPVQVGRIDGEILDSFYRPAAIAEEAWRDLDWGMLIGTFLISLPGTRRVEGP